MLWWEGSYKTFLSRATLVLRPPLDGHYNSETTKNMSSFNRIITCTQPIYGLVVLKSVKWTIIVCSIIVLVSINGVTKLLQTLKGIYYTWQFDILLQILALIMQVETLYLLSWAT